MGRDKALIRVGGQICLLGDFRNGLREAVTGDLRRMSTIRVSVISKHRSTEPDQSCHILLYIQT